MKRDVVGPELMATGAKRKDAHDRHLRNRAERVRARVGKLHPFDTIEPRRTALLVIDMQNYFVKPGHQGEVPMARGIVPNINRLGGELRRRGGHVVWIRNGTAGTRQSWSNYHDGLMTPERMRRRYEAMEEGQEGFEFWHQNDIRPEERASPRSATAPSFTAPPTSSGACASAMPIPSSSPAPPPTSAAKARRATR